MTNHYVTRRDADERYGVTCDENGRQKVDPLYIRGRPRLFADKLVFVVDTVAVPLIVDEVCAIGDEVVRRRGSRERVGSGVDGLVTARVDVVPAELIEDRPRGHDGNREGPDKSDRHACQLPGQVAPHSVADR